MEWAWVAAAAVRPEHLPYSSGTSPHVEQNEARNGEPGYELGLPSARDERESGETDASGKLCLGMLAEHMADIAGLELFEDDEAEGASHGGLLCFVHGWARVVAIAGTLPDLAVLPVDKEFTSLLTSDSRRVGDRFALGVADGSEALVAFASDAPAIAHWDYVLVSGHGFLSSRVDAVDPAK